MKDSGAGGRKPGTVNENVCHTGVASSWHTSRESGSIENQFPASVPLELRGLVSGGLVQLQDRGSRVGGGK